MKSISNNISHLIFTDYTTNCVLYDKVVNIVDDELMFTIDYELTRTVSNNIEKL